MKTECNTDWIFVIVQLHCPKRLSHRHYTIYSWTNL